VFAEKNKYTVRSYGETEPPPVEWQKKALDSIHVFEVDSPSTCVFLDNDGKPLRDHNDYKACVPIEYFDPENQGKLDSLLAERYRNQAIRKSIDVESIRKDLIKKRPEWHAFKKTEVEQLQINKVFVELTKYPTISSDFFNRTNLMLVVGNNHQDISQVSTTYGKDDCAGYYSDSDQVIALTNMPYDEHGKNIAERINFSQLVAEEMMHALDYRMKFREDQYLHESFPADFTSVLEKHTARLGNLLERWKSEIKEEGKGTLTAEESAFTQKLMRFAESRLKSEGEVPIPGKTAIEAWETLARAVSRLKQAYTFKDDPIYADLDEEGMQTEIVAKIAKYVMLGRFRNQYADRELYKEIEEYIYTPLNDKGQPVEPSPMKDLLAVLEKKEPFFTTNRYDIFNDELRQQKVFAEHIAKNVDRWAGKSTAYVYDGAQAARGR